MSSVRDRGNITEYISLPSLFEEFFASHKELKGIIKYSVDTSGESHLIGKGMRSSILLVSSPPIVSPQLSLFFFPIPSSISCYRYPRYRLPNNIYIYIYIRADLITYRYTIFRFSLRIYPSSRINYISLVFSLQNKNE